MPCSWPKKPLSAPLVTSPYTLVYSLHPSVYPTSSSPISCSYAFLHFLIPPTSILVFFPLCVDDMPSTFIAVSLTTFAVIVQSSGNSSLPSKVRPELLTTVFLLQFPQFYTWLCLCYLPLLGLQKSYCTPTSDIAWLHYPPL